MTAFEHQEGGDHYKALAIQPAEYCHKNGIGFMEGSVVKYVTRWRAKGGVEDLRKARHFLDLLIEMEVAPLGPPPIEGHPPPVNLRMHRALHEIVEEWAGAECGESVHAQEAYAIGLAKRMYSLAVEGLAPAEPKRYERSVSVANYVPGGAS